MSSNKNKKRLIRTVFTANGTCGCAKKKAIEVHEPTPKPKTFIHSKTNSNSSKASSTTTSGERNGAIDDDDFSSTATFSEAETSSVNNKRSPLMNTVAVEKDSEDPYHDFRHSMLQMIFEKEIHSGDDLQELLQCFLHLNATCYHDVIVKAFNDICQESFPDKVSSAVTPSTTETETETETSMTATTSSSERVTE